MKKKTQEKKTFDEKVVFHVFRLASHIGVRIKMKSRAQKDE